MLAARRVPFRDGSKTLSRNLIHGLRTYSHVHSTNFNDGNQIPATQPRMI